VQYISEKNGLALKIMFLTFYSFVHFSDIIQED